MDVEYPADFPVYGAGCMFVNRTHVLAGIHNRQVGKRHPRTVVSGFGGKREDGESWKQTAFRETIEELFDVRVEKAVFEHEIYPRLLTLRPLSVQYTSAPRPYITIVYSFDHLRRFLAICRPFVKRLPSSAYSDRFPRTEVDLVMDRNRPSAKTEITHILLWSRYAEHQNYWIAGDLFGDLGMFNHNYFHQGEDKDKDQSDPEAVNS